MHFAIYACGLPFPKRAAVQASNGVGQQLPAVRTKLVFCTVMGTAIYFNHCSNGFLFPEQSRIVIKYHLLTHRNGISAHPDLLHPYHFSFSVRTKIREWTYKNNPPVFFHKKKRRAYWWKTHHFGRLVEKWSKNRWIFGYRFANGNEEMAVSFIGKTKSHSYSEKKGSAAYREVYCTLFISVVNLFLTLSPHPVPGDLSRPGPG